MNILAIQKFQITPGGIAEAFPFIGTDGFNRTPMSITGAGADFDKNKHVLAATNQVNLTARGAIVTVKYAIPFAA